MFEQLSDLMNNLGIDAVVNNNPAVLQMNTTLKICRLKASGYYK